MSKKIKKLKKRWRLEISIIKVGKIKFAYTVGIEGDTSIVFCFVEGFSSHIGYVCYRPIGKNGIEVLGSYVLPWARREGGNTYRFKQRVDSCLP